MGIGQGEARLGKAGRGDARHGMALHGKAFIYPTPLTDGDESDMDRYQQDVEFLTENPHEIQGAWIGALHNRGGSVFSYANLSRAFDGTACGCLTMIRLYDYRTAETDLLTQAIRHDARLPETPDKITVDHLPIFAGWQRRIDQELGRTPPPLDPRLPAPKGDIEIPAIEYEWAGGILSPAGTVDDIAAEAGKTTVGGGGAC